MKREKDEGNAAYRHARFTVTMIVNMPEGSELEESAVTIEVDADKLFGPDLDYEKACLERITGGFHRLAKKWKAESGWRGDDA